MKLNPLLYTALMLLSPLAVLADPVLVIGTPGDDLLSTPTGPSPNLNGLLLTFSSLTDGATYTTSSPLIQDGVTISSPDGLSVEPFSTQSNPNFLVDDSSLGTANITIGLPFGTSGIGVGIADSDSPANIELQALGSGGVDLGPPFGVTIPETTVNPGNGYFAVEDNTADIFGLQITQSDASAFNSGLAIADVQVAPEPSTLPLVAAAIMAIIGISLLRKRV